MSSAVAVIGAEKQSQARQTGGMAAIDYPDMVPSLL